MEMRRYQAEFVLPGRSRVRIVKKKEAIDKIDGFSVVVPHIGNHKRLDIPVLLSCYPFLLRSVAPNRVQSCGIGCLTNLPEGASGFTTVELKSNHLGTAQEGIIECSAQPRHRGTTTQVWDATVTHRGSGKTLALFRCTQMILMPKESGESAKVG